MDGCLSLSIPLPKNGHVCSNMCLGITAPITAVLASLLQLVTCTVHYDPLKRFEKSEFFQVEHNETAAVELSLSCLLIPLLLLQLRH